VVAVLLPRWGVMAAQSDGPRSGGCLGEAMDEAGSGTARIVSAAAPAGWRWVCGAIVLAAALLRLWNLGAPAMTADESGHYFIEMRYIHQIPFAQQRFHPVLMAHAESPNAVGHPLLAVQLTNLVMRVLPDTATTARGVQAMAGVAMVGAICLLGKDLFGERAAIVAGALASFMPLAVRYNRSLYLDSIFALLVTLMTWTLFRAFSRQRPGWTVAAGVLLGLAGATKTSAPLLLPFVAGYGLFCHIRGGWSGPVRHRGTEKRAARSASEGAAGLLAETSDGPGCGRQGAPPAIKLLVILATAFLVFLVDVAPAAYWKAIVSPVDPDYQRTMLEWIRSLWEARGWLLGVSVYLWTPLVLIAAALALARAVLNWRHASRAEALLVLWLLSLMPLVLLHLPGTSGENGYLPLVAPVCLLAQTSMLRLRRGWRALALTLTLVSLATGAVLFGWRLMPTPYCSYMDLVDFGPGYYP